MNQAVVIEKLIDDSDFSGRQFLGVGLCGLLAIAIGFDNQAMASAAAQAAVEEYRMPASQIGAVFSAVSAGWLIGALAQGPLGDRCGRKIVMLGAFFLTSVLSLLTVVAATLDELIALRFLTEACLGSALPNLFAITAEYVPKRRRSTFVTLMFCGVTLGGILGGTAATNLPPLYGWRSVFYSSGLFSLALLPAVWLYAPESFSYLMNRPASNERIRHTLARLGKKVPADRSLRLATDDRTYATETIAQLFIHRRRLGTLLLSTIGFTGFFVSFSLSNWLPLVLSQSDAVASKAVLGGLALSGSGILGAVFFGVLADKYDIYRILCSTYLVGAVSVAFIGAVPRIEEPIAASIFMMGFFCIGSQMCFPALVAASYPSALRASALGWTMSVGHIGVVFGPMITGSLLEWKFTASDLFYLAASLVLATLVAVAALSYIHNRQLETA